MQRAYFKQWADLLAGPAPRCCEVHNHQLISTILQDAFKLLLQRKQMGVRTDNMHSVLEPLSYSLICNFQFPHAAWNILLFHKCLIIRRATKGIYFSSSFLLTGNISAMTQTQAWRILLIKCVMTFDPCIGLNSQTIVIKSTSDQSRFWNIIPFSCLKCTLTQGAVTQATNVMSISYIGLISVV